MINHGNGKSGFAHFRQALVGQDFAAADRLLAVLGDTAANRDRLHKIAIAVLNGHGKPDPQGGLSQFEGETTGQLASWIAANLTNLDQPGVPVEVAMSIFLDTHSPFRTPPNRPPAPSPSPA